jgi:hypothetical protein
LLALSSDIPVSNGANFKNDTKKICNLKITGVKNVYNFPIISVQFWWQPFFTYFMGGGPARCGGGGPLLLNLAGGPSRNPFRLPPPRGPPFPALAPPPPPLTLPPPRRSFPAMPHPPYSSA